MILFLGYDLCTLVNNFDLTYLSTYQARGNYRSCRSPCNERHLSIFHSSRQQHRKWNTYLCISFIQRELANRLDNTLHASELSSGLSYVYLNFRASRVRLEERNEIKLHQLSERIAKNPKPINSGHRWTCHCWSAIFWSFRCDTQHIQNEVALTSYSEKPKNFQIHIHWLGTPFSHHVTAWSFDKMKALRRTFRTCLPDKCEF